VGCTGNSGYCPVRGWTASECACLGAMQTGPWCDSSNLPPGCVATGGGLLANGHVDLQTDPGGANWANSIFNPVVNIELGIAGIACNRAQAEAAFPGCSEDQYMIMAIGNFNSYGSTKSCTVYNLDCDSGAWSFESPFSHRLFVTQMSDKSDYVNYVATAPQCSEHRVPDHIHMVLGDGVGEHECTQLDPGRPLACGERDHP